MGVITDYHIQYLCDELEKELNPKDKNAPRKFSPETVDEQNWDKDALEEVREKTLEQVQIQLMLTKDGGLPILYREGFVDISAEIFEKQLMNHCDYADTFNDFMMGGLLDHVEAYFEAVFDRVVAKEQEEQSLIKNNGAQIDQQAVGSLFGAISAIDLDREDGIEDVSLEGVSLRKFANLLRSPDYFSITWQEYESRAHYDDVDKFAICTALAATADEIEKSECVDVFSVTIALGECGLSDKQFDRALDIATEYFDLSHEDPRMEKLDRYLEGQGLGLGGEIQNDVIDDDELGDDGVEPIKRF